MKLVRYGRAGREKPGLIDEDGVVRDQSRVAKDITAESLSLCLRLQRESSGADSRGRGARDGGTSEDVIARRAIDTHIGPWERARRYEAAINAERATFGLKPIGIGFPALHPTSAWMAMPPGASKDGRTLLNSEGIAVEDGGTSMWPTRAIIGS